MRTHIAVLAWLHILIGAFNMLGALVAFGVAVGFSAFFGGMAEFLIGSVIGGLIGLVLAITSLPNILAGIGLLARWGWARILAIILGIFNLFNFPLGTVLGVYTFWVLFQDDAKRQF